MPFVEVRGLAGGRFPRVSDDELETFANRVQDAGLKVSGVSPGLCKCPVDDSSVEPDLAELLPRACEWALRLGTDRVSAFAFRRNDDVSEPPQAVVDRLGEMAATTAANGCRLTLENEAEAREVERLEIIEADVRRRAEMIDAAREIVVADIETGSHLLENGSHLLRYWWGCPQRNSPLTARDVHVPCAPLAARSKVRNSSLSPGSAHTPTHATEIPRVRGCTQ